MKLGRRNFVKGAAISAASLSAVPSMLTACSSPKEKLNIALIGCRSMGFSDLKSFLRKENIVECVALCDVDSEILEAKAQEVEKMTGMKPKTLKDFRDVLADKSIDIVIVGTPDHWHAHMMMMALEAGKHVYVEKPMGHSIEENYAMVEAQKKYPNLYVQVGMWQRSSKHWFEASDIVKSGVLGKVCLVKAWVYKGYDNAIPVQEDGQAPDTVDYKMWLGPAPERPFNLNRFHYRFRWWWDYAGGAMTDWGVHLLDFAMYAMDCDMPESVSPGGGVFFHDKRSMETPDTQQASYTYKDHTMLWECGLNPGIGPYGKAHGVAFVGNKGTLIVDRAGYTIKSDRNDKEKSAFFENSKVENHGDGLNEHVENFLSCIRKGGSLNAPVEVGAQAAIVSEMGNIAFRTGDTLHWDKENRRFKEESANGLLSVKYNKDWPLPRV